MRRWRLREQVRSARRLLFHFPLPRISPSFPLVPARTFLKKIQAQIAPWPVLLARLYFMFIPCWLFFIFGDSFGLSPVRTLIVMAATLVGYTLSFIRRDWALYSMTALMVIIPTTLYFLFKSHGFENPTPVPSGIFGNSHHGILVFIIFPVWFAAYCRLDARVARYFRIS